MAGKNKIAMGFILLNLRKRDTFSTLQFFYGRYENGVWRARLASLTGTPEVIIRYRTATELYRKLVRVLRKYGNVQGIWGNPAESAFIEHLQEELRS